MAAWAGDDKQFIVDNVDTTKHIVTLKEAGDAYYRPGLEEPLVLVNSMSMLLKAINVTVTGEMWGLTRDETNNVRYNPTPGDPSSWVECSGTLVQISISACGNHVYGVDSTGAAMYRPGFCNGDGSKWEVVESPPLEYICCSAGGNHVWAVTTSAYNISGMVLSNLKYKAGKDAEWLDCEANLKQLSISADGNHVFALNSAGVMIYRPGFGDGSPEAWVEACPGGEKFDCVAVSFDAAHIYASCSKQQVWYRNGLEGTFVNTHKNNGSLWIHIA